MFSSRRDNTGLLQVITAETKEVVEAAQNLKDVTKIIKELSGCAHSLTIILFLSEAKVAPLTAVFCMFCLQKLVLLNYGLV